MGKQQVVFFMIKTKFVKLMLSSLVLAGIFLISASSGLLISNDSFLVEEILGSTDGADGKDGEFDLNIVGNDLYVVWVYMEGSGMYSPKDSMLYFSQRSGSGVWSPPVIISQNENFEHPRIVAYYSQENGLLLHVFYHLFNSPTLYYTSSTDGVTWSDPQALATYYYSIRNYDVVVDASGTVHLVVQGQNQYQKVKIYYLTKELGQTWSDATVAIESTLYDSRVPRLSFSTNLEGETILYVAYEERDYEMYQRDLSRINLFTHHPTNGWQLLSNVTSWIDRGPSPTDLLLYNNFLHISFWNTPVGQENSQPALVRYNQATNQSSEVVYGTSTDGTEYSDTLLLAINQGKVGLFWAHSYYFIKVAIYDELDRLTQTPVYINQSDYVTEDFFALATDSQGKISILWSKLAGDYKLFVLLGWQIPDLSATADSNSSSQDTSNGGSSSTGDDISTSPGFVVGMGILSSLLVFYIVRKRY